MTASLPLVARLAPADHAVMAFYLLLTVLLVAALLAPRYGADTSDGCNWRTCP